MTSEPSIRNSPAIMERVASCPVCASRTHSADACTALTGDLKEGFYSPPSGYRDEDDCEDDSLIINDYIKENYYTGNKCLPGKLLASIGMYLFPSALCHQPIPTNQM